MTIESLIFTSPGIVIFALTFDLNANGSKYSFPLPKCGKYWLYSKWLREHVTWVLPDLIPSTSSSSWFLKNSEKRGNLSSPFKMFQKFYVNITFKDSDLGRSIQYSTRISTEAIADGAPSNSKHFEIEFDINRSFMN